MNKLNTLPPDFILTPAASCKQSEAANELEESQNRIETAFAQLALRDIGTVKVQVTEALAQWIDWTKIQRPELNEIEAMLTAKKLLVQWLRSYIGQVEQLL